MRKTIYTVLGEINANDMKVGPDGAIYVGTQSGKRKGISDKIDGKLYRISSKGEVDILLDGLILSNGMAWSIMDIVDYIPTPCKIPTSCGFCGENLDILAITTASSFANLTIDKNAGFTILKKMDIHRRKPYLYSITKTFDDTLRSDWLHYGEEGSKILADAVIKKYLEAME